MRSGYHYGFVTEIMLNKNTKVFTTLTNEEMRKVGIGIIDGTFTPTSQRVPCVILYLRNNHAILTMNINK